MMSRASIFASLFLFVFPLSISLAASGGEVLFVSDMYSPGVKDIYAISDDGSNPTKLTSSVGNSISPVWSPDGLKIAYVSNRSGSKQLWVMGCQGDKAASQWTLNAQFTEVCTNPEDRGSWSSDNQWIYFSGIPTGSSSGYSEVYKITTASAGSTAVLIVSDPSFNVVAPQISPDNQYLVYVKYTTPTNRQIYRSSAGGSGEIQLTTSGANFSPYWAPDGAKIYYVNVAGSLQRIWMMNYDGTGKTQVGPVIANAENSPAIGFSGSKVLYTSAEGGDQDVWCANRWDGSGRYTIFGNDGTNEEQPVWMSGTCGSRAPINLAQILVVILGSSLLGILIIRFRKVFIRS